MALSLVLHRDALGDVPKGVTVNTTIERPDGISLHVVHTDQPNDKFEEWCSRRRRFAPSDSISRQHSDAVTL